MPRRKTTKTHRRFRNLFSFFSRRFYISRIQFNVFGFTSLTLGLGLGLYFAGTVVLPRLFAASNPYTWDLSNSGSYTLSDSSAIEVTSNSARLKVQEYSSDANTVGLYHFNESVGTSAPDSSSFGNVAAVSNGSFITGNFNNALSLNGFSAYATVPDSASLSLSGANTIEAWIKFNNPFSAYSTYQRQGIVDKGAYRLFYDNETGQIVYQLAPNDETTWTHVAGAQSTNTPGSEAVDSTGDGNGTWDYNGKAAVSAAVHVGSDLYVGLGSAWADAEVWKWNGTVWSQVGGDGRFGSWDNDKYEIVTSIVKNGTSGTTLYVGLGSTNLGNDGDGEVWAYNTVTEAWSQVGGDGLNGSWVYGVNQGTFEIVNALYYDNVNNVLYAGLGSTFASSNSDAEVWRWTGSGNWAKVGGDSNQSGFGWASTAGYENVFSITSDGTNLYVGLGSTAGDGDVWMATLASLASTPSWSQVGGDTLNTSWPSSTYEVVQALYVMGSYVYAGLGNSAAGDAEVWRRSTAGGNWAKVGECASTSACTANGWANNVYEQIWSIWGDGTTLYVGTGNGGGDNDVWAYNGTDTWTQIAGNASANDILNNHTYTRMLYHDGTYLYAGLQHISLTYTGELWRYNGTAYNWSRIGGNYLNKSWGFYPMATVEKIVTVNGKLYIGTGNTVSGVHGAATVWEFNGTDWTLIGGQGINSGWGYGNTLNPGPYERISTMIGYDGHLYIGLGMTAGDGEVWAWELVAPNTWTKVGGDGGFAVAVSSDGTNNRVMTSPDSTTWLSRTSAADLNWNSITHANNIFVAVAGSGSANRVMTSVDGLTWTSRTSASDNTWSSVTYGEGLFVAVSSDTTDNRVMTSPNGIDWTNRTSAGNFAWKSVTYGNGQFVAVANSGTGTRVMTSPNGITWTLRTSATDNDWTSVTYGNGLFVAVASSGTNDRVMTSSDGITWASRTSAADNNWTGVTFGNNLFVAVANTGTTNRVMTSPDGITWTIRTAATSNNWTSVTWSNNVYTAVASSGTGTRVMTSANGTSWTTRTSAANNTWNAVGNSSSWTTAVGQESVDSMTVHECPGATQMCLYVGLGYGTNDGRVWAYNSGSWMQIAGNGTTGNWEAVGIEIVNTLVSFNGKLYAGLGNTISGSNGDAEIWEYSGTGTTWTKVAGDGVNSSWNYVVSPAQGAYENALRAMEYNGMLYVALGSTADGATNADAEVWSWAGSGDWTKVGGDGVNSSWNNSYNYEAVRALEVYNGDLYAGLGDTAATGVVDAEVWKFNGTVWTLMGGEDAINSSWPDNLAYLKEQILSLGQYNGKLYAATGNSTGDASVWAYGGNKVLRSSATTQDTNWHHVLARYDGTYMKLFIDGVENASTNAGTITIADNANPLLIGSTYGAYEQGRGQGMLEGLIDELRISNTSRSSFTSVPYVATEQTISNTVGRWSALDGGGIGSYSTFTPSETPGTGTIRYRLSSDGGTTWKYWSGAAWDTSNNITTEVNTAAQVNSNISTFPITDSGVRWQAVLKGDGVTNVVLNSVTIDGVQDNTNPAPPSSITALDSSGGVTPITSGTSQWYSYPTPYFSWSGASDTGGAGIAGYYVYFGTDDTATPSSVANTYQTGTSYTAGSLTPNTTYYLRIQTKDKSQRVSTVYPAFIYNYDSTAPSAPTGLTVTPSGYASTNSFVFDWQAVTDLTGSTLAGYQYQAAETVNASNWSTTITDTTLSVNDLAYQVGINKFFVRSVDVAGNASAPAEKTFLYGGDGPSAPKFLDATPDSNTVNSFAFTWSAPDTYSGAASDLTYCYSVNVAPSANACTYTAAGITALSNDSYATLQGINTMFVAAKNPVGSGGAINYANYTTVTFGAYTAAPGIPLNTDVADVSVKSTSSWKLAVSWEPPTDSGSGIEEYEIWRSADNVTFSKVASTTGIAYVDTGLAQATYYYKVKACDSVANCGSPSSVVSMMPTGKYTEAAALSAEPVVSNITTKKATIAWSTDRTSSSAISYGTKSGSYFEEEPSNSTQVTDHTISLSNLKPGTKYFFVAKWTDEDGNMGISDEDFFTTSPAPTVTDPKMKVLGIDSVTIEFTVKDASKVKIYYGKTSGFGGTLELSTSTKEATYQATLDTLEDGMKYYYKINTLDIEDDEYEGSILSFETLPRPKIGNVKIQQVKGTAQPTMLISWTTNTEVSSIVTYYPTNDPSQARDEVNVALTKDLHRMLIKGLLPETGYSVVVKGRDKAGNEAVSDPQRLTTATDTRPPLISDLKVEGSVLNAKGQEVTAQLVVSWNTDEPGTSQVEYGEGTGSTYSQTSSEDSSLTYNHVIVITGLNTSKVYHLRAVSKDKAANIAKSVDTVSITPKASDSALNLVITNLQEAFGFLGGFKEK